MRNALCIGLLAAAALAACASFPQLDAAISPEARRAPYPELVPSERLLARRDEGRLTEADGAALQSRAEGLRARAGRLPGQAASAAGIEARYRNLQARARLLRGQSVDDDTRLRLRDRLRRLGG